MSEDDLEYIKEDLRSPCTQEIAVFRAFFGVIKWIAEDLKGKNLVRILE